MSGENDARFFRGILQSGEDEAHFGTAEAAEIDFVGAGGKFLNTRWIVEAQHARRPAAVSGNFQ